MLKQHLLKQLQLDDPFSTIPQNLLPFSPGGNNDAPIHQDLMNKFQPKLIIEVGSWKGSSAIAMAKSLQTLGITATIICVDTWLGGLNQWTVKGNDWSIHPFLVNGYPSVYYQFFSNMIHAEVSDYILPIPNTSINVARYLQSKQIQADMVYIDGSHEYEDVYQDLNHYYPLVKKGGIIWGDDWHIHANGVVTAVTQFAHENRLQLVQDFNYNKWFLTK